MTRKRVGNERLGASRADAGRARALRPLVGCSSSHIAGHQQRLPPDGAGRAQRAAADMHMSLRLGLTWGGGGRGRGGVRTTERRTQPVGGAASFGGRRRACPTWPHSP